MRTSRLNRTDCEDDRVMKILFISHLLPYPPRGGAFQRTFNLIRQISHNHQVHLLAIAQRAHQDTTAKIQEAVEALQKYCKFVKAFRAPGDSSTFRWGFLLFSNLFSTKPYSVWKFQSPQMVEEIRRIISRGHFDLIHIDTIDLVDYLDDSLGLPIVANHHNIESDLLARRAAAEKNLLAKFYLRLQAQKVRKLERRHAPRFAVNLVVSAQDKKRFESIAPTAEFEIIANGTDVDYFKPSTNTDTRELIFVGGLGWFPNRDAMLYFSSEILPLIQKQVPDVVLNIIGRTPPAELSKMAALNPAIRLHGFVDDIRNLMARAAVYVVPIRVGGGTRLKILDAMAAGKAIVSTTIGAEGILAADGSDILFADTAESFAERVVQLLNDKQLRRRLETNARMLAEKEYSWDVIGKRLNQIYADVAGRNQR